MIGDKGNHTTNRVQPNFGTPRQLKDVFEGSTIQPQWLRPHSPQRIRDLVIKRSLWKEVVNYQQQKWVRRKAINPSEVMLHLGPIPLRNSKNGCASGCQCAANVYHWSRKPSICATRARTWPQRRWLKRWAVIYWMQVVYTLRCRIRYGIVWVRWKWSNLGCKSMWISCRICARNMHFLGEKEKEKTMILLSLANRAP